MRVIVESKRKNVANQTDFNLLFDVDTFLPGPADCYREAREQPARAPVPCIEGRLFLLFDRNFILYMNCINCLYGENAMKIKTDDIGHETQFDRK